MGPEDRRRERWARLLGAVVAAGVMALAWFLTGWPAPGIAAGLAIGTYLAARRVRRRAT